MVEPVIFSLKNYIATEECQTASVKALYASTADRTMYYKELVTGVVGGATVKHDMDYSMVS